MARDEATGKSTIRAIKLREPFQLDGQLDESIYREAPGFGGMLQLAPRHGQPSTERTEIWVSYDAEHIYVSARCWDTAPADRWIANELRRDTNQMRNNDHFGVGFDTFYDRRSGFMFYANPLGGFADYSIVNEGSPNFDWNPVWDVRTGRFDGGWTVEMAIPFKSLRYRPGVEQTWGVQIRRSVLADNEWSYLTPIPIQFAGGGPNGVFRVSLYADLVGIEAPPVGRNLEVKPFATSGLLTDRTATPTIDNDATADVGLDVKYAITQNLTADF